MTVMFRFYIFALAFTAFGVTANAQAFDPFDGQAAAFRVNLKRYFKDPEAEFTSRKHLLDSLTVFTRQKPWTPRNISQQLAAYERSLVSLNRHYAYFQLLAYKNKLDTSARVAMQQLDEAIDSLNTQTNRQVRRPLFTPLAGNNTYPYHYLLEQIRLKSAHELKPAMAAIADKLSDPMLKRLTTRYDNLMDGIKPGPGRNTIMQNPDATARSRSIKIYFAAYDQQAEVMAATLIDITALKNVDAQLRGFKSAPEATYARRLQLTEDSVRSMLRRMAGLANVLKGYQKVQADQVKITNKLDTVHSWDMNLPSGYHVKQMGYQQVGELINAAFEPLGSDYQRSFAWLLDPTNGALDIAAGPDRINENTSVGYPGVPTTLYMKAYQGSLGDILRLSHEGGHAIHAQLMSGHLAVPSYATGPGFLFEAYAMLNELLVLDELQKQAVTTEAKAFYTKALLDKLSLEIFTAAEEGSFEQGLYDGLAAQRIHDRRDIDSLYSGIMNQYDLFFQAEPERKSEWINKRLVFDDPLYNINYLYAMLLSCRLYQQAHDDPADFTRRYAALLNNGFEASANELIRKYMGFSLNNQTLLRSTIELMERKTGSLKELYQEMNKFKQ